VELERVRPVEIQLRCFAANYSLLRNHPE
jgi:hypothetical protein